MRVEAAGMAGTPMRIAIFGATGLVGRGALLEALDSSDVQEVISVGRRKVDVEHAKLRQVVHDDFLDFQPIAEALSGLDACLWCVGISSAGVDEATYTRVTHDFTVAAAKVMRERNPAMRFCFVSGAGTDGTEQSRTMWARVKGRAENAVKAMEFKQTILFRPAFILPRRGCKPRGALYRALYVLFLPLYPLLRVCGAATTTTEVGRALLAAASGASEVQVLNTRAINRLARVQAKSPRSA